MYSYLFLRSETNTRREGWSYGYLSVMVLLSLPYSYGTAVLYSEAACGLVLGILIVAGNQRYSVDSKIHRSRI